jgi:hypothetical protein
MLHYGRDCCTSFPDRCIWLEVCQVSEWIARIEAMEWRMRTTSRWQSELQTKAVLRQPVNPAGMETRDGVRGDCSRLYANRACAQTQ